MATQTTRYLTYIKTSGNQRYLYETNRLSESTGASELIALSCTQAVEEAAQAQNIALHWIVKASGVALFWAATEDNAKKVIEAVTQRALQQAPTLQVSGAFVKYEPTTDQFFERWQTLKDTLGGHQANLPSRHARFPQLPFLATCQTSNLPAYKVRDQGDSPLVVSRVSDLKFQAAQVWPERLEAMFEKHRTQNTTKHFLSNTDELEKHFEEMDWVAVVHIDGNGVGQLFASIASDVIDTPTSLAQQNEAVTEVYANASNALAYATESAFVHATEQVFGDLPGQVWATLPLLIGGDDITLVCDAKHAMAFCESFLTRFAAYTANQHSALPHNPIPSVREKQGLASGLSACAGIAIVKPHYPFYSAYLLAESLASSSKYWLKSQKLEASALDFHVLYDSHVFDLDSVREKKTYTHAEHRHRLYAGPYLLTADHPNHGLQHLKAQVSALQNASLPSTQLHEWRKHLYHGHEHSDRHLALSYHRYAEALEPLLNEKSFFQRSEEKHPTIGTEYYTYLLDALDISPFWSKTSSTEALV